MGNFEKLVVLLVLFLSAVVLAVSLTQGEDDPGDSNPLQAAERGEEVGRKTVAPAATTAVKENRPTLSSEVGPGTAGATPSTSAPAETGTLTADGRRRVLRLGAGLEPSPLEDYMVYTVEAGDTWTSLADRFYGNRKLVALLRGANEDLASPIADQAILVPIYDFRREGGRPRATPAPRRDIAAAGSTSAQPVQTARPVPTGPIVVDGMYTVQGGDNLSTISEKVYGKASRWREIWNANRDRISDPDWLDVGTKLRIP